MPSPGDVRHRRACGDFQLHDPVDAVSDGVGSGSGDFSERCHECLEQSADGDAYRRRVAAYRLSVSAVDFGGVPVGTTSAVKTVYLYNYQLTPITVSPLSVSAPYAISGGTCQGLAGGVLAATTNCTIQLTLTPTVPGAVPATSLRSPRTPRTAR